MSYTRGPWKADIFDNGGFNIEDNRGDMVIASRNGYDGWGRSEECKANARLIASAPCLLSALETILNERGEEYGDCDYQSLWAAIEAAKPAIATATAKGK